MKIKLKFAPGCFDNFEGTQEDLDKIIEYLRGVAETGEIFENLTPVDTESYYISPRTLH